MRDRRVIGVIGGMGPYAGLDLVRNIFDQTEARTDQGHVPVALLSYPSWIPDRSAFLEGRTDEHPADALTEIARRLDDLGASVAGMPCNTAHAPRILEEVRARLRADGRQIRLMSMIEETVRSLGQRVPDARRIGALGTRATMQLRLYADALEASGYHALQPDERVREQVQGVIFDPSYGVKAQGHPVTARAREDLLEAIAHLKARGAEAVILGCTELPLAVPEPEAHGLPLIDPSVTLARALLRETYPERLKRGR